MSTKRIRKVLRDLMCDENTCRLDACRKHEAIAEVEAIEKAAAFFVSVDTKEPSPETMRRAAEVNELFERIAKESTP